jgi:uncharacterized protein (TIGR03437 family)
MSIHIDLPDIAQVKRSHLAHTFPTRSHEMNTSTRCRPGARRSLVSRFATPGSTVLTVRLSVVVALGMMLGQPAAYSQQGIITTVAGGRFPFLPYGRATASGVDYPNGIAADTNGNLYFGMFINGLARLDPYGNINLVAPEFQARLISKSVASANGLVYYLADLSLLSLPTDGSTFTPTLVLDPASAGLANGYAPATSDAAGNLYLIDPANYRIVKLAPNGIVSTVAGVNAAGKDWDGAPSQTVRLTPLAMASDTLGNLYVADRFSVKKITPAGQISPFAGTRQDGYSGDGGPATAATFAGIAGIAVDQGGNVYVTDAGYYITDSGKVRKIATSGIITTIAGTGRSESTGDGGPATAASFAFLDTIAIDSTGNIFVADGALIRKIAGGTPRPLGPVFDLVANAGSGNSFATTGSWISIFGTNLAASTATWDNAIVGGKLPTTLAGAQVRIGPLPGSAPNAGAATVPAYLAYVSPTQINALLPEGLSARTDGTGVVSVSHDATSAWGLISIGTNAPSWFTYPIGLQTFVAALFANELTYVAPVGAISGATSRPAKTGDILSLYANSVAALPNCPDGVLLTQVCLPSDATPTLTLGGMQAKVLFVGKTAPGLFQINVQVPAGVPSGIQPVALTTANNQVTQSNAVLAFQ